ncbi:ABC transporter permease [Bradyrhizobium sp. WSM 1791]|uniref:ABC transporter permease n=2 Tax=Bradyrhizobium australiense TaxID=2721161 RepID=A0A7Y4GZI4_9BRAD|nr:ABC transporter permease [Bradyrhizobium australiense]
MSTTQFLTSRLLPTTIVGVILLILAFPIIVVLVVSFSSANYLTFPPPGFSFKWYKAYFGSTDSLQSTWLSFWIAASDVLLSTTLGALCAVGITRLPRSLRVFATGLILSPLIVPGIMVAIGVYYFFSRYGLIGTPIWIVLAHTYLAVPFVVTSVSSSLAGLDPRLEQAALSLRGPSRRILAGDAATDPSRSPGRALFAFITSFDEVIVALFLSGFGAVTLPRRMWDDLRLEINPTIAAVSTLTILLGVLLLGSAHFLRRRSEQLRTV